jgi:hypothetical protein
MEYDNTNRGVLFQMTQRSQTNTQIIRAIYISAR